MKLIYDLKKDGWRDDFFYVWGPQAKTRNTFELRTTDGWVCNSNQGAGFDYISPISKKKYEAGVSVSASCRFYGDGAPLIVFSDDIVENTDKTSMYRLHFEVVIYKDGINVWRIVPRPETPKWPVESTLLFSVNFPIPEGEEKSFTVKIEEKRLVIALEGNTYTVDCDEIPKEFHVGFTACEGACEFGSFSIETTE